MAKIVTKEGFKALSEQIRMEGKVIVLCHGVFDLVHPGHIAHLEQAKNMGDILVVSVTAAQYVRKGPGRPYFDDEQRMKFLSQISCIDYVILSNEYTVQDIVDVVKPDLYVKGSEYARDEDDITGNISKERAWVEKYGGRLVFTGGPVFSSTKLINNALGGLSDEILLYVKSFKEKYNFEDIQRIVQTMSNLRILVIGEVIIDKYTYCTIQGLMSKDRGYSARLQYSESYMGGALAVARHLKSFANEVTLMSVVGDDAVINNENLPREIEYKLFKSKKRPTIVKHRFLEKDLKRDEFQKIFVINNISEDMKYEDEVYRSMEAFIAQKADGFDAIFVCDFGHGLLNKEMIRLLEEKARFLALNCQTNSSNYGLNLITKYKRADAFSVDQKELKLAFPEQAGDEEKGLDCLQSHLGGKGWLTRGSAGAIGYSDDKVLNCPAFTLSVKDTIGAGDAFFAIASISAASGAADEVSLFLGNVAGALATNIVGNKDSIEKVNVLKFASTLLNI
ncbi:MAG: adenylyltransferase/cytidyltransferase family protein [Lachnospiraceae bacterium]|nr:adenylyltransferase/cytidyltransferase family protein [Lachnospiraceae bacterium]